jgi:hypothetical protein
MNSKYENDMRIEELTTVAEGILDKSGNADIVNYRINNDYVQRVASELNVLFLSALEGTGRRVIERDIRVSNGCVEGLETSDFGGRYLMFVDDLYNQGVVDSILSELMPAADKIVGMSYISGNERPIKAHHYTPEQIKKLKT